MKLEVSEQVNKFQEFLDKYYQAELLKAISNGQNFIIIDFKKISEFSPELAEDIIESPEETLKAGELAIKRVYSDEISKFNIRLKNLPESQKVMIRDIRSKLIGKLIVIEGLVRQKSDVRPQMVSARFECPSCGNIITVLQTSKNFKEPTQCPSCGRKGKFKLLSKDLVDAQGMIIEEMPEQLRGGEQPKRLNVLLKEDLVSPISDRRTNPGSKVQVVGWVREEPIINRNGTKSTRFNLILECNYIEPMEESFYEVNISPEEEEEIKDIASDPKVYDMLIESIAPSIYGYQEIKEALVLQLFGGVRKERPDKVVTRGDIHILLVGDPGAGKSQLLKRIASVAPKARYVSGKGVSGAGLTASVVRDEFLGGWSLEAGALVLANDGMVCIDELDKMSQEDRSAMHEALEQQSVSVAKANIQATLLARTTVLAAANPKLGRFDPYQVLAKQIDLSPTLINRFDLIFTIRDLPDKTRDANMAKHILNLHKNPEIQEPKISTDLLKKYIAYARQKIKPKLTDSAIDEIEKYYVTMRNSNRSDENSVSVIPISARQLEALVRLAEASAKVRLSEKVLRKDAKRAIKLLNYCLAQVGMDEKGRIDIDRITTGIGASQRSKILTVRDIIIKLSDMNNGSAIDKKEVIKAAEEKGIKRPDVEEALEKLKRNGDIFEPERDKYQWIS